VIIEIRPYMHKDWETLASIHDRARLDELRLSVGPDAFRTLEQTAEGEGLFDDGLWVAVKGGRIAGFIAVNDDEITWLYVDPDCYRQGIGRALLRHVLAAAEGGMQTTILDGNHPALQLYLSEGFEISETRDGTLQGLDAVRARGHILTRPSPYAQINGC
jgi:GNAT superfamily N-acetyltransferase